VATFEYLEMKFKIKILHINKLNKVKLKEFLTPYIPFKSLSLHLLSINANVESLTF
jgi:hypothetical protein